ncbi:hypothetical protein FZC79_22420 [Rossellomorea vietnamensis]|uniref:DUF4367 domain-containing protein n=1 Tax=Rossellomorea vietnamensis TaxID=218284 RepID=A0A5D4K674_9BACI|nr:hypothetical protein [Rossellomorea vietnamensis]TYR72536.1 hypothetical protein FZC79_22420 [Rossellomorea vietnamensis]
MDELKNLRTLMKADTFRNHGFTSRMKNNIVNEINSKEVLSTKKRIKFAPVLSSIFAVASISAAVYYGGSELGIIENHSAETSIHYYNINIEKPSFLGNEFKFPAKVPFKVSDVKTTTRESPVGLMYTVTLIGEKKETLRLFFQSMNDSMENLTFAGEQFKAGNFEGYYSQEQLIEGNNDLKFKSSSMRWLEEEQKMYSLHYKPGESGRMLYKEELVKIAQSFR